MSTDFHSQHTNAGDNKDSRPNTPVHVDNRRTTFDLSAIHAFTPVDRTQYASHHPLPQQSASTSSSSSSITSHNPPPSLNPDSFYRGHTSSAPYMSSVSSLASAPSLPSRFPRVEFRKFSGKKDEDVESWRKYCDMVKMSQGWPSGVVMGHIGTCMDGAAWNWWCETGSRIVESARGSDEEDMNNAYVRLMDSIVHRFKDPQLVENSRINMRKRKQNRGERVMEYRTAMDEIFRNAHFNDDDERMRIFIDGLISELQVEVLRAEPTTYDEAFNAACKWETRQARIGKGVNRRDDDGKEDKSNVRQVKTENVKQDKGDSTRGGGKGRWNGGGGRGNANYRGGGGNSSSQLDDRECYYCHKKGHIARECFARQKDEGGGRGGFGRGRGKRGGRGGRGGATHELTCFVCNMPGHFARDCNLTDRSRSSAIVPQPPAPNPSASSSSTSYPSTRSPAFPSSASSSSAAQFKGTSSAVHERMVKTARISESAKINADSGAGVKSNAIKSSEKLNARSYFVEGEIGGIHMTDMIVDTGAQVSMLPMSVYERMSCNARPSIEPLPINSIDAANGSGFDLVGNDYRECRCIGC